MRSVGRRSSLPVGLRLYTRTAGLTQPPASMNSSPMLASMLEQRPRRAFVRPSGSVSVYVSCVKTMRTLSGECSGELAME